MEWSTGQTLKAAYLIHQGHALEDVSWDGDECVFYFADSSELQKDLRTLLSGRALVEPRNFNRTFGEVRKAMFDHPDSPRNRRAAAAG